MKSITLGEFLAFEPCWAKTEAGMRRLRRYAAKKERWIALDILALSRVPAADRIWAVTRPGMIPDAILHEFACRCAEHALDRVDKPDPRSIAAIATKRAWMRGEAGGDQLAAARDAAWASARASARAAAWASARDAAWAAAWTAEIKWQVAELTRMLTDAQD